MGRAKFKVWALIFPIFLFSQTYHSGTIAEDETWSLSGSPHIITGNITVNDGVTLTIEPGCEVKFDGYYTITVYGRLVAEGLSDHHIVFTSNGSEPAPGDWNSVKLHGADNGTILRYCDFLYGGGYSPSLSIYNSGTNVSIQNVNIDSSARDGLGLMGGNNLTISALTVRNSGRYGIYVSRDTLNLLDFTISNNDSGGVIVSSTYPNDCILSLSDGSIVNNGGYPLVLPAHSVDNLSNVTVSGNNPDAIKVLTGHIKDRATWSSYLPYHVVGTIYVDDGGVLSIDNGATLKFLNSWIEVRGNILVNGTEDNPVLMTSLSDSPSGGDWGGIRILYPDSVAKIEHAVIEYGGGYAAIYLNNADSARLKNVTVRYSSTFGIELYSTVFALIESTTVENCENHGIYIVGSETEVIGCTIDSNNGDGIKMSGSNPLLILHGAVIQNNNGYPLKISSRSVTHLEGPLTLSGNGRDAIFVYYGNLDGGYIRYLGYPYDIQSLTVPHSTHVVVEAGNIFNYLSSSSNFTVYGSVDFMGTEGEPIIMRNLPDSTAVWKHLYIASDDTCRINHLHILNAGANTSSALYVYSGPAVIMDHVLVDSSRAVGIKDWEASSVVIKNSLIRNSQGSGVELYSFCELQDDTILNSGSYALKLPASYAENLSGLYIEGNNPDAIFLDGYTYIDGAELWKNFGVPYYMNGYITVCQTGVLTLEPGTELLFTSNNSCITVIGGLMAIGTEDSMIKFSKAPTLSGNWSYIRFYNTSQPCTLRFCEISYGGYQSAMVRIINANVVPHFEHCVIKYSNHGGIYLSESQAKVINSLITANEGNGIYLDYNSSIIFGSNNSEWNDIYNNAGYEVYNDSPHYINAPYIYWGYTSEGEISADIFDYYDDTTKGVVNFSPWETSPHYPLPPNEHAGILDTSEVWRVSESPHYVISPIVIPDSVTLTIEPGCEVRFFNRSYIKVFGELNADGTSNNISFAGNGPGVTWLGLRFEQGSSGLLMNCTIDGATSADTAAGVYSENASVTLENCTISGSKIGAYIKGNLPLSFTGNTFISNGTGLLLEDLPGASVGGSNTFQDNGVGVHIKNSPSITVSSLSIENSTSDTGALFFENCGEFTLGNMSIVGNTRPLTIDMNSYPSSSSIIPSSGNTNNAIWVLRDTSNISLMWRDFGIPYEIGRVWVGSGTSLTVLEGVTLEFRSGGRMYVLGNLSVSGTSDAPITVTAKGGTSYCGLYLKPGSSGSFNNAIIEHAEVCGYSPGCGIRADSASLSITNSTLRHNGYGIYLVGTAPYMEDVLIDSNRVGIYFKSTDDPNSGLGSEISVTRNFYAGIVYDNCSNVGSINGFTITDNGGDGALKIINSGEFHIGENNVISGNEWPLTINVGSFPDETTVLPTSGNENNLIKIVGGGGTKSGTLPKLAVDYYVAGTPVVDSGLTLTIAPGTKFYILSGNGGFRVYGTLLAVGTSQDTIIFTKAQSLNWSSVSLEPGSQSQFKFCQIEYAERGIRANGVFPQVFENCVIKNCNTGVYIKGVSLNFTQSNMFSGNSIGLRVDSCSNVFIDNQVFYSNTGTYGGAISVERSGIFTLGSSNIIGGTGVENSWPLRVDISSYPDDSSLARIPLSGNAHNAIEIYGGILRDTMIWKVLPEPLLHVVTLTPEVDTDGVLIIEDGATVEFDDGEGIEVMGELRAVSGQERGKPRKSKIKNMGTLFTRWMDDDLWSGIKYFSGSRCELRGVEIEYSGRGPAIWLIGNVTASIESVTIKNSLVGLRLDSVDLSILQLESSTFQFNDTGIKVINVDSIIISSTNTINQNGVGISFVFSIDPVVEAAVTQCTSCGISFKECTFTSPLEGLNLTGNNGLGALHFVNCGKFVIGASNVITGNSYPLAINLGSYPDSISSIPTGTNENDLIIITGESQLYPAELHHFEGLNYLVLENVKVDTDLTIYAGDTLYFDDVWMGVYGRLVVNGTPDNPVMFTKYGDTGWRGLKFYDGSTGKLNYLTVEHVTTGFDQVGVYSDHPDTLILVGSILRFNTVGFKGIGGEPRFVNTAIVENVNYGVYLTDSCLPRFGNTLSEWNDIYGNGSGNEDRDFYNDQDVDVTAEYIYWGTVDAYEIEERIHHFADDAALGTVDFTPWTNAGHNQIYGECVCGDVNSDGLVTGDDFVYLGNYLFFGGPAPLYPECADVNGDGFITGDDFVYLGNYIFYGGPAPQCEGKKVPVGRIAKGVSKTLK